ncbi:unnamed protein product [Urochloa decumbens]|uniref:Uncharacterized protein n=1 Tax=Urochloa decumbens TaxID=240449 RepID=A0ABC9H1Y4_9POAL
MMASRACVLVVAGLVALCAAAASVSAQSPPRPLPSNYHVITPGKYRRDQQLACNDDKTNKTACMAKCDRRCPNQCVVLCPGCKTFCMCDFYPGVSCGDPRFTGGDGNNFYFHGKKDQDFCILSDANLHINAHFIGKRNPAMSRDFTWIQALGIRFAEHRLYMGAKKTAKWNNDVDRLELAFDGAPIDIPTEIGAEDSRIHNYGVTEDDSLAHFDLGFKFLDLTEDVHGVLGQTYRSDYVNQLSVSSKMPVMGGAPKYLSSDIFATDCAVARFGSHKVGISMVTARAY